MRRLQQVLKDRFPSAHCREIDNTPLIDLDEHPWRYTISAPGDSRVGRDFFRCVHIVAETDNNTANVAASPSAKEIRDQWNAMMGFESETSDPYPLILFANGLLEANAFERE